MRKMGGGGKEDVGRMRFKVKDDAIKSGTNHEQRFGEFRDGSEKERPIPTRPMN